MFASLLTLAVSNWTYIATAVGGAAGFKAAEVGVVKAVEKAKAWVEARAAKAKAVIEADAAAALAATKAAEAKAAADAEALGNLIETKVRSVLGIKAPAPAAAPLPPAAAPTT